MNGARQIKTIGDAYVACAGAFPVGIGSAVTRGAADDPQVNSPAKAAERAVKMALAMQQAVIDKAMELGVDIGARIGVHTGMVMGGIIGTVLCCLRPTPAACIHARLSTKRWHAPCIETDECAPGFPWCSPVASAPWPAGAFPF